MRSVHKQRKQTKSTFLSTRHAPPRRSYLCIVMAAAIIMLSLSMAHAAEERPVESLLSGSANVSSPFPYVYAAAVMFTPQVDGYITQLGIRCSRGTFVRLFQGDHELVSIYNSSSTNWGYKDISPVALNAGTRYKVVTYTRNQGGCYALSIPQESLVDSVIIHGSSLTLAYGDTGFIPSDEVPAGSDKIFGIPGFTFVPEASPPDLVFGMWQWDASILGDKERIQEMIQFSLDLGIDEVSFSINWNGPFENDPNNITNLEYLIERIHDNGMKIDLLLGDASWIYHPEKQPSKGYPEGGVGYDFGRRMIERFIAYQDQRFDPATGSCYQCFDGIRLDVEPHGLRDAVTNGRFPAGHHQRQGDTPEERADDSRTLISGTDPDSLGHDENGQPLYFIRYDVRYPGGGPNGEDIYDYRETSVAHRTLILERFLDMLQRYKAQLHNTRGAGHITNSPEAVAKYLVMAMDVVPWYWTLGLIDEIGNPIPGGSHPQVSVEGQTMDLFQAILQVPDRIGVMGYRDRYEATDDEGNVLWANSFKYWNEGDTLDGNGPRGLLEYMKVVNKPVSLGLEFIDGVALGEGNGVERITLAGDPYAQAEGILEGIINDLKAEYPMIEGVRYHEYTHTQPGKSSSAPPMFNAFKQWAEAEIFAAGKEANRAHWEAIHTVTPATAVGFDDLVDAPVVPDGDALTLRFTQGGLAPRPGLLGSLSATIDNLPAEIQAGDFEVKVYTKVIGDAAYFQGGAGYPDHLDALNISVANNGMLAADGSFTAGPLRLGDATSSRFVWWADLHNANGHFIRRFVLDPLIHCNANNEPVDCIPASDIAGDRFYDAQDPLNIDVSGILPAPHELTFSEISLIGDIAKTDVLDANGHIGPNAGAITGRITDFPEGMAPQNFHIRTWVEYTHVGHPPLTGVDPNEDSEKNVWFLLSQDVAIDAGGYFTATNLRPINPTGDSIDFGGSNGSYKIWISVHETLGLDLDPIDKMPRAGCPNGLDQIKPAVARYLDMDFSLIDTYEVDLDALGEARSANIDLDVEFIKVDDDSGLVIGVAKGLTPGKEYHAYVWTEWYDVDRNIWHERARPKASNHIEVDKGGYFHVPVTQLIPPTLSGIDPSTAERTIWVSIHDRPLNLNEFDVIDNWTCGGEDPAIIQDGNYPLWMGRNFHMDSSFDYYEGYRPLIQTGLRDTGTPAAPHNLGGVTSSYSVSLSWYDNSSQDTGFKIEQRTGNGAFVEIAKVLGAPGGIGIKTFDVFGLDPNASYTFRVRAFNIDAAGNDVNSAFTAELLINTLPLGRVEVPFR